jgi:peptidoglycan/xylan/chitin deacetylase (PgdA/CDA1 family)
MLRIFLFHRVSPINEEWALAMHPQMFEKCINYITKKYQVVLVEDYFLRKENYSKKKDFACITFDDGFKDNIEYAAPILKKYNCPASFYIGTNLVDKDIPTWTHLYDHLFYKTKKKSLALHSSYLTNEYNQTINLPSDRARNKFRKQLFPELKKMPHRELQNILAQISGQFNDVSPPKNYMMNWDEVNQLKNDNFVIGSHTKTHPLLSTIDDDFLLKELKDSADRIREMTGVQPVSLSYPIGDYSIKVKQATQGAGYKIGLAVNQQFYNNENDLFEIPRVDLYVDAGWFKTRLRINGTMQTIKRMIKNG